MLNVTLQHHHSVQNIVNRDFFVKVQNLIFFIHDPGKYKYGKKRIFHKVKMLYLRETMMSR